MDASRDERNSGLAVIGGLQCTAKGCNFETAEETRQRRVRIGMELGGLVLAKLMTRPTGHETWRGALLKAGANVEIDRLIGSKINEAFPDKPPAFRTELATVTEALCGGKFSLGALGAANAKEALREWLGQRSPAAASEYDAVDFLYGVYERLHPE